MLVENNGLKQQIIKKAIEAVVFYREDIIAEWHKMFDK